MELSLQEQIHLLQAELEAQQAQQAEFKQHLADYRARQEAEQKQCEQLKGSFV